MYVAGVGHCAMLCTADARIPLNIFMKHFHIVYLLYVYAVLIRRILIAFIHCSLFIKYGLHQ